MDISCLHLSALNIASFQAAAPDGVRLTHFLHSDILLRARLGQGETAAAEIAQRLARLGRTSDGALLTCSGLSSMVAYPGQISADHLIASTLSDEETSVDILFAVPDAESNLRKVYAPANGRREVRFTLMAGVQTTTETGDAAGQAALVARFVAQSTAARVLILQAPLLTAPPDDPRAIWGPERALRALIERRGKGDTGLDPMPLASD